VTDGICRIYGLADGTLRRDARFPENIFGLALNLEQDSVGAVVLGEYKGLREGEPVKTTGRILECRWGPSSSACRRCARCATRRQGPDQGVAHFADRAVAPGVIYRKIGEPARADRLTGDDSDGAHRPRQRELIIGDRQTGKTALAIDTVIIRRFRYQMRGTSPSARSIDGLRTSCASSRSTARWRTRSSSRRPHRCRPPCSTSPPIRAARWRVLHGPG